MYTRKRIGFSTKKATLVEREQSLTGRRILFCDISKIDNLFIAYFDDCSLTVL